MAETDRHLATDRAASFLSSFVAWARSRRDVTAVALVGSWATGTARPGSDVDLVVVVADPAVYLEDDAWLRALGPLRSVQDEDWGLVRSRRARYEGGLEVEFGLTTERWLSSDPPDAGTAGVIAGGARVLVDRTGDLGRLVARVGYGGRRSRA